MPLIQCRATEKLTTLQILGLKPGILHKSNFTHAGKKRVRTKGSDPGIGKYFLSDPLHALDIVEYLPLAHLLLSTFLP